MTHCSYPVCVRERQGDSTCHLFWTRFGLAWDRVRTFITSLVRLEGGKRGKRLAVEMQVQWCVHDTGGCGVAAPICHISQHEQGCGLHNAHSAHCSWAWEESSMDMLCIRKKKAEWAVGSVFVILLLERWWKIMWHLQESQDAERERAQALLWFYLCCMII